jgi:putative peptidoglycan lipid II flippase
LASEIGTHHTVARAAASAGAATLTSRLLGVVREAVLAAYFGSGAAMDAYRVAFRIPNMLRDLFAEGAMSAAFVPTFTQRLTTGTRHDAFRLGNNLTTALLFITGVAILAGWAFTDPIVRLMVKAEYEADLAKLQLTILLARVMLPFLAFVALAAVAMGMLNSLRHFFIPALSPAMFNIVSIASVLILVPVMIRAGVEPIAAAAIGTVAGGLSQWLVQWPLLRREGFRFRPHLDLGDEGLKRVLVLMGPGTLGLAATQINVFINTQLATGEGTGAVSVLEYAFRLMYLPIGLFGVSVAVATTPVLARQAALGEDDAVRRTIADSVSLMMMLSVPATIGLVVLAHPIVQAMYERGNFTPADTAATAVALQGYALGLVGYSVVRITSPAFYAFGAARAPVKVGVASVILNAGLNIYLVRVLGYAGLAIGTSISALFNGAVLLLLLRRRLHGIEGRRLAASAGRILLAAAAMGIAAGTLDAIVPPPVRGQGTIAYEIARAARLFLVIGAALAVLAASAHLLRVHEFRTAMASVRRRLGREAR